MFGLTAFSAAPFSAINPDVVKVLLGVTASGFVGSVTQSISIQLTGAANAGTVGSLGVSLSLIGIQGTQAVGVVGNIIPLYWRIIDNSQTPPDPNWVLIDDSQTPPDPNWMLIDDSQTPPDPNWMLINTPT